MTSTVKRLFQRSTGIFCFRLSTPSEKWLSLRTRDPIKAMMIAATLNAEVEMARQKEPKVQDVLNTLNGGKGKDYKIDLSKGILETDGPEDHARAMDALSLMSQARTQLASSAPAVDPGQAVQKKYTAKPFSESSSAYILDCVAVGN